MRHGAINISDNEPIKWHLKLSNLQSATKAYILGCWHLCCTIINTMVAPNIYRAHHAGNDNRKQQHARTHSTV